MSMLSTSTSAREKRGRRAADREGYRLHKLRGDDGYWLIDIGTGALWISQQIAAGVNIGEDLDVIENSLK